MLGTFSPAARLGSLSSSPTRLPTRRLAASISYAARLRERYPFIPPNTSVDHLVIGGGVIGLSVAAGLVNTAGRDRVTFVVERRRQVGRRSKL
jgi:heterodisulfide reductase subunit A-like polyferredoxin